MSVRIVEYVGIDVMHVNHFVFFAEAIIRICVVITVTRSNWPHRELGGLDLFFVDV